MMRLHRALAGSPDGRHVIRSKSVRRLTSRFTEVPDSIEKFGAKRLYFGGRLKRIWYICVVTLGSDCASYIGPSEKLSTSTHLGRVAVP